MQEFELPVILIPIQNIIGNPISTVDKSFDCYTLGEARNIPIVF
jgi:hypothetical protein